MKHGVRFLLLVIFITALFAGYSDFTDADLFDEEVVSPHSLQATTLDFSQLNSATEQDTSLLFSISDMKYTGLAVESVRIKNTGQQSTPFTLSTRQTGGTAAVCVNLQLKIFKNWAAVYSGPLLEAHFSDVLPSGSAALDYVFALELPGSESELMNSSCHFAFDFSTQRTEEDHFSDTEVLQNTVTTGAWTHQQ